MRIYRTLWTCCLSLLCSVSFAQLASGDFRAQTERAFLDYYQQVGLQEKLYVVTDKPYYSAGESIYFSAFLLHPLTFKPAVGSAFIYVELISADGRLIARMKVMGKEGRFDNALRLPTKLDAGRYTLRAYTRWMSNFDPAFLFHKEIEIGNYIDDAIQTSISYQTRANGAIVATLILTDNERKRIANQAIEYTLNLNGKSKSYRSWSNEQGIVTIQFRPSEAPDDCLQLRIKTDNRRLERTIQLPSFSDDFDLQFFPEGGNLIAGIPQTVAFKAIGLDGKGVEIEGYICDQERDTICNIRSLHKGMGLLLLAAKPKSTYTAIVTSEKGLTRSFELPAAQPSGCAIQVKRTNDNVLLMKVQTSPDLPIARFGAVVQSRGVVEAVIEELSHLKRIPLSHLKSGIALISIVDKEHKQVVAERLVFIDNDQCATAEINVDKSHFAPREKCSIDLRIRNSRGTPVSGSFAVSVTDSEAVEIDPASENIFSYLLLSSDLKGTIEQPAAYFNKEESNRHAFLDLIMLTNGWRRYDVNQLFKGSHPKLQHKVETTQRITGRVTGLLGKVKDPSIIIFKKGGKMLGQFPLTASNRFEITGIDMPDTAYYYIQALNRKGLSQLMFIHIDPETFPSTNIPLARPYFKSYKPAITESLLMGAKERYYTEGGMRIIDIDPIVVTAKREPVYTYSTMISTFNALTDELSRYASIYDALQRFRQLEVDGQRVRVRNRGPWQPSTTAGAADEEGDEASDAPFDADDATPAVLINDIPADISDLDTYAMEDVTKLAYLEPYEAVGLNVSSPNGVIIMEVRQQHRQQSLNASLAEVLVGGYAKPVEFYAPRYDTFAPRLQKDLRTTIAWEPNLRSDTEGAATLSFWTADRPNDYRVVVEGITDEGELCRATYLLKAQE